ncbi:OLC1v1012770C1 [Oldenlandia corymbosa var. corymbosa]|uniref:OLC1v1012770C1 n=1 Tax=Oldenlandia corymbosa var. corymbosa TaxID=529605 RepID=A0AAV1E092_OLDCO|nr:OLC1v1012770C1 [Oldenlandia corymbosa var. corymbosa]
MDCVMKMIADGQQGPMNKSFVHHAQQQNSEQLQTQIVQQLPLDQGAIGQSFAHQGQELNSHQSETEMDWESNLDQASEVKNKPQPKATRGPTLMGDIWAKVPNAKPIVIEFNKNFQPIGPYKKKLTEFLGTLARNDKFVPINVFNWRHLHKDRKDAIIRMVKTERLGRAPTRVELFASCYCDSECNPSNPEVGAKVMEMKDIQSKLPPGSEDPLGPNDTFAKVMGKDPPGRVRMTGLGVCPSDLWVSNPSRNACYQMVLEHQELVQQQQATIARMEEKMDNTSRLLARFEEKLQHQQVSSLGNQSNSTNLGQNLKAGREVLLKNMEGKVVALGWLNSLDPNQVVGGAQLGTSCYEVHIYVAMESEEELMRPYTNLNTIGDAVGTCIAWSHKLVMHVED